MSSFHLERDRLVDTNVGRFEYPPIMSSRLYPVKAILKGRDPSEKRLALTQGTVAPEADNLSIIERDRVFGKKARVENDQRGRGTPNNCLLGRRVLDHEGGSSN
jgi:hypothetical protein